MRLNRDTLTRGITLPTALPVNTMADRIVTGYPRAEAEKICAELGYTDQLLDTGEIFHL